MDEVIGLPCRKPRSYKFLGLIILLLLAGAPVFAHLIQ